MSKSDHGKTKVELVDELDALRRRLAQTEAAARPSEADDLYRRLIRFLPDAVRIACDGVVVYANDAAAELFGTGSPDLLIGRSTDDFNPEEDRAIVRARRRTVRAAGFTPTEERRKLRLDGSIVHIEVTGMRIDWHGKPATLTVMRDIGARVEGRRQREENEARFAALAENVPGAVYQCALRPSGDFAFSYVSDGVRALFGTTPDAAMNDAEGLFARIHADDRNRFMAAMHESAAGMVVADLEFRVLGRKGRVGWVRSTARPRQRDDDDAVIWDGVFLDVTDRQAALESLRTAKDAAELANRSKTEFLTHMSHELRTPLNTIMGFSEVIEAELFGPVGSPRYTEYASDIRSSGAHLLSLINEILDLSKIEAGKLEFHDDVIDVGAVIEESLALLKRRTENGKLRLAVRIANKLPHLRADERRLRQILLNLLSNAAKYTPDGGTVRVSVSATSRDGMSIKVTDNGIGMSAEDCQRVFRPFEQVDNEQNRRAQGTGLGLPLARSLVEGHGGRLALDSAPGKGTRITVRFPAMRLVA
ncbi:MAG: PAS domain S-box protein [Alphaproteobacteria bacterium]|nr:PAS domain S-box protein [Alphaproteobacteria bacterium]